MATPANLTFLPWLRQGPASAIREAETLGANLRGAVDLPVALTVNGAPAVARDVRLRGPADVLGIDPSEIVRVEPRPGTTDFEPNYFPCIEFDRPDFPWLFTPARADGQARLRPWLCLVVVPKQEGVLLPATMEDRLPVLEVGVNELPDLADSWAWVHAQVASDVEKVRDALVERPELSVSRLLCPRVLAPNTQYVGCVVPTFDLGRRAGLNEPITESEVMDPNALADAWSTAPTAPHRVKLPVYYSWEFRTGVGEDFEFLVRLLHAEPAPERLGLRAVDISRPGFPLPESVRPDATVDIEGALQPIERSDNASPWSPNVAVPFQAGLAEIVNAPGQAAAADPTDNPLLAPPLYGRWHAARATVASSNSSWFDVLNLDPRNRVVAALGTRVVQEHQEALMASAWEQAGDLQRANQRVRRLQLSFVVNASLHARHFSRLDQEGLLRVSAPAFARVRGAAGSTGTIASTLVAAIRSSGLPLNAMSASMRRIGRARGPLTRRVRAQGGERPPMRTWIGQLNTATGTAPSPLGSLATIDTILQRMPPTAPSYFVIADFTLDALPGRPGFQIAREGEPVAVPPVENVPSSADDRVAGAFRVAAREHLVRIDPARQGFLIFPRPPLAIGDIRATLLGRTRPQLTVTALAQATIAVGPSATPPAGTTPSTEAHGLETIMAAPQFRQPMYESLRDLGQELLLPGLEGITAHTVLGLKTNRRFVEAYMVGLNEEMGRELLWRGFPTDQRGTYFAQFWDARTARVARPDIAPLHEWRDRRLGDPEGAPAREQFVLLLRSDLLRRYPTAVIYATPADVTGSGRTPSADPDREVYPAFRGSMDPDVAFFGFDLTVDQMLRGDNGEGHYIVIQEQPAEPRFGLDIGTPVGGVTHLRVRDGAPAGLPLNGLEWGRNGAHMAAITRQLPVRIAIHASRFVRG